MDMRSIRLVPVAVPLHLRNLFLLLHQHLVHLRHPLFLGRLAGLVVQQGMHYLRCICIVMIQFVWVVIAVLALLAIVVMGMGMTMGVVVLRVHNSLPVDVHVVIDRRSSFSTIVRHLVIGIHSFLNRDHV
jgi:hypothetical protein